MQPRFTTPHVATILTGVLVGGVVSFVGIDEMVDLTNIGTLFAFVLVRVTTRSWFGSLLTIGICTPAGD